MIYLLNISGICFVYCFTWGLFVFSAAGGTGWHKAQSRTPGFEKAYKWFSIPFVITGVLIGAYMVISNKADSFLFALLSIMFWVATCFLWGITHRFGRIAFETSVEWVEMRNKSYVKALLIVALVLLFERGETYLKHSGYL
jgi:hypothetical protein